MYGGHVVFLDIKGVIIIKVLCRPVSGGIYDAMQKVKTYSSVKEMFQALAEQSDGYLNADDLFLSYYCYDKRIDWETYLVTTKRFGDTDYLKEYGHPSAIAYCTFK